MTFEELLASSARDEEEKRSVGIVDKNLLLSEQSDPNLTFDELVKQIKQDRVTTAQETSPALQKFLSGRIEPSQVLVPSVEETLQEDTSQGQEVPSLTDRILTQAYKQAEDFGHKVRLGTETAVLSTAGLFDFVRKAENWRKGRGFDYPQDPLGLVKDPSYENNLKKAIEGAYSAVGMEEGIAQVRDVSDIPFKLAGEFAGGTAVLGGLRNIWKRGEDFAEMSLRKSAGPVSDDVVNAVGRARTRRNQDTVFYGEEMRLATWGVAAGTGAAYIAPGTLEEKENIANFCSSCRACSPSCNRSFIVCACREESL